MQHVKCSPALLVAGRSVHPVDHKHVASVESLHLCGMICDQEVELLIPHRGFVAASVAGCSIAAAAHDLGSQCQRAVGIALPWETPHR